MTEKNLNIRLLLSCILWCLLTGLSFAWNIQQAERNRQAIAFETARAFFQQILITRRWNALHGGVYVPISEDTPPNPYLHVPNREIQVSDNLTLTLINPAYMTRQLSEIAREQRGVQFHITSLKPIRPQNAPTPWEADALRQFEQGLLEKGEFTSENTGQTYRYMAPLLTEKSCLRCHGKQGYKEGDVRGGISITLPQVPNVAFFPFAISHLAIALVGMLIIVIMGQLLAASYHQLRQQAVVDALTAIPNRRFFNEHLAQELRRRRRQPTPLSLVLCDIDYFKIYNDTFGHQAGDQCLRIVAQTLRDNLQRAGDFCARYGGEEFVLVLPDTDLNGAWILTEKIRLAIVGLNLANPNAPSGIVSVSFGIASDNSINSDPDFIIRRADQALYQAKQAGRNCIAGEHLS